MSFWKQTSIALCGVVFASQAWALEPCGDMIVDRDFFESEGGLFSTAEESSIRAAAERLEALDATVRVRTTKYVPDGYRNLTDAREQFCDAWGGSDYVTIWLQVSGEPNNNDVGVSVAPRWRSIVNEADRRALNRSPLGEEAQDGNYAAGVIATLAAVEVELAEAAARANPTPVERVVTERVVERVQAEPTDQRPWAMVAGLIALLIAAAAGLFFLVLPMFSRRREMQLVSTQFYGEFAKLNITSTWLAEFLGDETYAVTLPDWVNRTLFAGWRSLYLELNTRARGAEGEFQQQERVAEGEKYTSPGAFAQTAAVMRTLEAELEGIHDEMRALRTEIETEERLSGSIEEFREDADDAIESAGACITQIAEQGFAVTAQELALKAAEELLDQAGVLVASKSYSQAKELSESARTTALNAAEAAEALPVKKAELLEKRTRMGAALKTLVQGREKVRAEFIEMKKRYASASYAQVHGNGTEAEKKLKRVPDALLALDRRIEAQQWDQATAQAESVNEVLQDAAGLLDSVTERRAELVRLEADVVKMHEEAVESLNIAVSLMQSTPAFGEEIRQERMATAHTSKEKIRLANVELDKDRPDYVQAFRFLSEANALADAVVDGIEEDKAAAERKRMRALRVRDELVGEVAATKRYIQTRRSDMSWDTEQRMRRLSDQATALGNTTDIGAIFLMAESLRQLHEDVKDEAETEFKAAEAARKPAEDADDDESYTFSIDDDDDESFSFSTSSDDNDESHGW